MLAGFASTIVTPEKDEKVFLGGYGARYKCGEGIHDNIFAKALAIMDCDTKVILISIDVVCVLKENVSHIREEIQKKYGIDNVIVCATHDHSAPDTMPEGKDNNLNWIKKMEIGAIQSAEKALNNMEEVELFAGSVSLSISIFF